MKAILYAVALVAIAAGAFLSFSNKNKFQEQVELREQAEDTNKTVAAKAESVEQELKDEKEKLSSATDAKNEVEASIAVLVSNERGLRTELGELDALLEEQQAKLQAAATAIDNAKKVLEELGIPVQGGIDASTIGAVIKQLQDQKKELDAQVADLGEVNEGLQGDIEKNRAEIGRLESKKAERTERFRRNAMESVITAVDQDWGFVVIGAGQAAGFTPQTRLIVKRGGRAIAEVRPSSVEATQTIAEIDFDSVAPGVMLQAGDQVILAKPATN